MTTKKAAGHDPFSARRRAGFTPTPEREVRDQRRAAPASRLVWGFTMLETLVSLGVVAVIVVVVVSSLFSRSRQIDLDNTTRQIAALMREAQSRSMSQEGGAAWGVHIENSTGIQSFYALFKGSYSSSTIVGYYKIPSNVQLASSSIPLGNSLEIIFSQVSGIPSTSTSIGLNLTTGGGGGGSSQASVGRTSSGKIFFDDFNRSSL